ncbi:MAG: sensor histidine kinase [Gemmatimonadota bacterium]
MRKTIRHLLPPALAGLMIVVPGRASHAQQLPLRGFTSADGLAGDDVRALLQDSRGFLWIGTTTGLSRADGREFRNYGPSEGLPDASVYALLESRDGTLWVGTARGLARLEPRRHSGGPPFQSFAVAAGEVPGEIHALLEDRRGRVWVGVGPRLYVLERREDSWMARRVDYPTSVQPPPGSAWTIDALAEGADGSLWVGTLWGLTRILPNGRAVAHRVRSGHSADPIHDLQVDREGRLWIVHWGIAHRPGINWGIYVLHPTPAGALETAASGVPTPALHEIARRPRPDEGSRTPVELPDTPGTALYVTGGGVLGDARVHAVGASRDGTTWFATGDGLVRLEQGLARRFATEGGFAYSALTEVLEDRDEALWLASRGGGLVRYDPHGIVSFGERHGLPGREVVSILEDGSGRLCVVAVDAEGRRVYARLEGERFVAFAPGGTQRLRYGGWGWQQTLLQDRQANWWLPTGEGLYRYPALRSCDDLASSAPVAIYTRRDGLLGDNVFRVFEDSRGDVWVGTFERNGVSRWHRASGRFEIFPNTVRDTPTAFAEDRAGNVWMGFYLGGLARSRHGRMEHFGTEAGVPEGFVNALHVDRTGRLWVATGREGLARVDAPASPRPRFVRYTTADGLSSNTILSIVEDAWGRLYVGTGRGVDRLDPSSGAIHHLTIDDGLANNIVRSTFRDADGNLWFGTHQGLSRLTPRTGEPVPPPVVLVRGVRVAGAPQPVSELGASRIGGLRLAPDEKRLEIEFGGVELDPDEELLYQTRLDDVDETWSPASSSRSVVLANLGPGSYRLLVRALSPEGLASREPAVVEFTVLEPLWRSGWFLLSIMILAGLVAFAVHRYRLLRLLELERVRSRIATDLHDDLGARLSRVSILSAVASQQVGGNDREARRLMGEVGETARGLIEAAGDIAWSIDPRADDLASLAARVRRFASDLLDGRGIHWSFEAPPDGAGRRLTPEQRRHLLLDFQEAIHNALRLADATRVELALRVEDDRIEAEIRDNGRGFGGGPGELQGHSGRGLHNMRERAAVLGGVLEIESEPDGGARIRLDIPLSRRSRLFGRASDGNA